MLAYFGEVRTTKLPEDTEDITLDEADKKKMKALNKALLDSKSSNKSKYASWARHFISECGNGVTLSSKPCYHTSSHAMSCRVAMKMTLIHTCSTCNQISQKGKIGPRPIYLGSLYYRLDECVGNIVKSVGHYHVVTHADTNSFNSSYRKDSNHYVQNQLDLMPYRWLKWRSMGR